LLGTFALIYRYSLLAVPEPKSIYSYFSNCQPFGLPYISDP